MISTIVGFGKTYRLFYLLMDNVSIGTSITKQRARIILIYKVQTERQSLYG